LPGTAVAALLLVGGCTPGADATEAADAGAVAERSELATGPAGRTAVAIDNAFGGCREATAKFAEAAAAMRQNHSPADAVVRAGIAVETCRDSQPAIQRVILPDDLSGVGLTTAQTAKTSCIRAGEQMQTFAAAFLAAVANPAPHTVRDNEDAVRAVSISLPLCDSAISALRDG